MVWFGLSGITVFSSTPVHSLSRCTNIGILPEWVPALNKILDKTPFSVVTWKSSRLATFNRL
jgi:hypothetical protein